MSVGGPVLFVCLVYFGVLLVVARSAGRPGARFDGPRCQTILYCLGCCLNGSWAFYSAVNVAAARGLAYLLIAAGPIVIFALGFPLLVRVARLVKTQNITSVADFISARYGKDGAVAATVAVLAALGGMTFLASQIKIVSGSLALFVAGDASGGAGWFASVATAPLAVAALMTAFVLAIGNRDVDATEHQRGLMLVVGVEAIVKLGAFLLVGAYVTWGLFGGVGDLTRRAAADPVILQRIDDVPALWIAVFMLVFSVMSNVVLPQQFHAMMVESRGARAIRHAAWFVPLYFALFCLFVIPLATAAQVLAPRLAGAHDLTILALPMLGGSNLVALIGLIGGLSAATATTFVLLIVLSIMVSNELVMPVLLRTAFWRTRDRHRGTSAVILAVRRLTVVGSMACGYLAFRLLGEASLDTAIALAAGSIVQIATVCVGGLFWRRATARGALASLVAGGTAWIYTQVLPSLAGGGSVLRHVLADGPFGIGALRPTAVFGLHMSVVMHGFVVVLIVNLVTFVGVSLTRPATARERRQARLFVLLPPSRRHETAAVVTVAALETTVAHYVGEEASRRAFAAYGAERDGAIDPKAPVDDRMLQFAEHLIASVIGSASSRLVIALLSSRQDLSPDEALLFVDQVSMETQRYRDFLQHSISFAKQGMAVYDRNLRLVAWNQAGLDIFNYPEGVVRVGASLNSLLRSSAERGFYGPGEVDDLVARRREAVLNDRVRRIVSSTNGRIYESRVIRMPDVGLFVIYSDVTEQARSEEKLGAYNETLERRVRERTEELQHLNEALVRAKAAAEEANLSKTRFLAAASHDLLQPLNAARLYAACLRERMEAKQGNDDSRQLADNVGSSLVAVEEILAALLDISRLDAGAAQAEIRACRLHDILHQLRTDFEPVAREKGIRLVIVPSSATIQTDRRLLRRILQNLVSNAIKYTSAGRVIVGVRLAGPNVCIQVWDTGIGIPKSKQRAIFQEFERLSSAAILAPGVGLGLSIVERLGRLLKHEIVLRSKPGRGSVFSVTVPKAREAAPTVDRQRTPEIKGRSLDGLVVAAIDNDPTILSALTALLEEWGCRVAVGFDLSAVRGALSAKGLTPDVIVADYHLDGGDGIAVIAALRAQFGARHAMLATADRTPLIRERAHRYDIRVLNKPIKAAALRALLSQWRAMTEVD